MLRKNFTYVNLNKDLFWVSGDEVEDRGLVNGFMDPWKDESQLRELKFETTKEDTRPYGFETDGFCVLAGHVKLEENRQLLEIVMSTGGKMTSCGHVGSLDKRDGIQSCDTIMELGRKITIHSHMKNREKYYNQVKEDVQLDEI